MRSGGVYWWVTPGGGGCRYHRVDEPLRVAAQHGIRVAAGDKLGQAEVDEYDTIVVYQLVNEDASAQWEKLAARGDTRMVFDIDDAMWAPDWPAFKRYYTPSAVARLHRNAELAHVVTTSSWVIYDHMARYNSNVWFVPYTMPAWLLDIAPRLPVGAPRRAMGFAGSASHEQDMDEQMIATMLRFLLDNPGWDWHFWGKSPGQVTFPDMFADRHHEYPWTDDRQAYFRSLAMDACMAPLKPTLFNRCKSALRFIENSAVGVCSILQELDPYAGYATHGHNAYLVGPSGFSTWAQALHEVAADTLGRARIAAQARVDAAAWTTEANISNWTNAWSSV